MQNQVAFLRQFCNARGIIVDQCIEEYGSGLNYNRKKWNKLLDEVMEQKVKTIIITHKDRFIRFGYDWFEKFCMKCNTTIVVVNNEELKQQEEHEQDDNAYRFRHPVIERIVFGICGHFLDN